MVELRKLDPFYWFDVLWDKYMGKPRTVKEKIVYHAAEIAYALVVALALYHVAGILLHTAKPAVVVVSRSMEPTLYPGDVALVVGADPCDVNAPELNAHVSGYFTLGDTGITVVREGGRIKGFEINGQFVPFTVAGDIVVYYNPLVGKDIIHRAVLKIRGDDGCYLLTKGDNEYTNSLLDQECDYGKCVYPYVVSGDVLYGKVFFVIPKIGAIKLALLGG